MESTVDIVHAAQWGALRAWVDCLTPEQRRRPSSLAGWTVDDLVSHLARTVDAIGSLRPVREEPDPGTGQQNHSGHSDAGQHGVGDDGTADSAEDGTPEDPKRAQDTMASTAESSGEAGTMSVAEYLSGFADRAEAIAEQTRRAAAGSAADRGGELDAAYNQARRTLTALGTGDPVVQARGGRIRLTDFLVTRVVELVVHAGDLQRSVPDVVAPPVLDTAEAMVEAALRQAFRDVAGTVVGDDTDLARLPRGQFIDVASGREPAPEGLGSVVRAHLPLF